jgi:chemotaxis protein CheZ
MAVQRKIFRIEERARKGAPAGAEPANDALLSREFIAELQALRALIAPAAPIDRNAMEQARAQIAEAQAYKAELDLIHAAVMHSQDEMDALGADMLAGDRTARAGRELAAIVAGTEQATQVILKAAEVIDQTAIAVAAALKGEHDKGLTHDIQDRVVQIFEACNFQDLTGQRVANAVAALHTIEARVTRLAAIWQRIERLKPIDWRDGHRDRLLNGPKLPDDRGHSTQDDIDGMFGFA